MAIVMSCCALSLSESVTTAVKVKVPAWVGVPEIWRPHVVGQPGEFVGVRPVGKAPSTFHVYPLWLPPTAFRNCVYATPTVPVGRFGGDCPLESVIFNVVKITVKGTVAVPDNPFVSDTVTLAEKVPGCVGVPVIKPEGFTVSPGGIPVALQV